MNTYANARTILPSCLTIMMRELEEHLAVARVGQDFALSRRTVYKWLGQVHLGLDLVPYHTHLLAFGASSRSRSLEKPFVAWASCVRGCPPELR
jgi:hypothetical protein